MTETDALLALAEIAVAFAGFASVVVLFQRRNDGEWDEVSAFRYRAMVLSALMTAAFCGLPLVLDSMQLSPSAVWTVSSACLAVWLVLFLARYQFPTWHLFPTAMGRVRWVLFLFLSGGSLVLQLLNIAAIGFERVAGPYLAALVFLLGLAGWQFFNLVTIRPGRGDV